MEHEELLGARSVGLINPSINTITKFQKKKFYKIRIPGIIKA